jgi:hypothetical protein
MIFNLEILSVRKDDTGKLFLTFFEKDFSNVVELTAQ